MLGWEIFSQLTRAGIEDVRFWVLAGAGQVTSP
jgi:hypothetical protein